MAKKSGGNAKRQIHESGEKALEVAQARNAGAISSGTLARSIASAITQLPVVEA